MRRGARRARDAKWRMEATAMAQPRIEIDPAGAKRLLAIRAKEGAEHLMYRIAAAPG